MFGLQPAVNRRTSAGWRLVLAAVLICAGFVTSFAQQRDADLFASIFNRSVLKQKTIQSVRARFTETTTSSLLTKPIVAHGTVVAAPPGRVLMTYTDPESKIIAVDGKTLTVAWPDRKERERLDISQTQKRVDQYFTRASIDDLRSMFAISAEPDAALKGVDHVRMRPTRKQIKQGLEQLDLWIERDAGMLVRMTMVFAGGDEKTISLEDVVLNPPVTDETFRIKP
jgi:outer membrane lipoprotein-sorting protein